MSSLSSLSSSYTPEDIWNADKSGIFFRALPDRMFAFRDDRRAGSKKPKDRVTVLFACSMTGEKCKMFVIGRSLKPHCFQGVTTLPVWYRANVSSWITSSLFVEYLQEWNRELRLAQRRILILIDNCTAHPSNLSLSQFSVSFFQANTMSILQPLDQGVIRTFKGHFRRGMATRVLSEIDGGSDSSATSLSKKISLLDAIILMDAAWTRVSSTSFRNCWTHGGHALGEQLYEPQWILQRFHERRLVFLAPVG